MTVRAAALTALLASTGLAHAQTPHDTLTIGIAQFPSSLQPDIDPEVVRSYAMGFVIRPITAFDKDWHNTCLLCTELPTLDNGLAKIEDRPDGTKGMAVTLKLKPGLQWGDGQPVTATDIAFTWKLGSDPASGFSNNNPWNRATSVDVVDDATAVLHLDKVRADYDQWDQILPEHIEGAVVATATAAGAYINGTTYNRAPVNPGLYDGPYMITAYDSGNQIVMEPNPHWNGTKPGFKRIVLRHIENTAALQANLLSGDVDMVAGEGVGLTIDQALNLQKAHPDAFHYEYKPSLTYEHIDLAKDNPLLQDVRVRRALLMAIDRQTMVDRLFQGKQPVAATWVNPLSPNLRPGGPRGEIRPGRRQGAAEAGRLDPGQRRHLPQRRRRQARGRARHHRRQPPARAAGAGHPVQPQGRLRAATIRNEPARTLFGDTLKHRSFTGMEMYAWSSAVTETPLRTLDSTQIPTAANNYGGSNYIGFSDPKMDADIAAAESELDPAKQKAIWADMQVIYADALPVLPLFFRAEAARHPALAARLRSRPGRAT